MLKWKKCSHIYHLICLLWLNAAEKISNKFLDKIFQGRIQIRQKHTIANSIAYLRQIHAWKNFFPWKERKKLNSYVKQNQFRFFCSYYSFVLLKEQKIIIKTFVSTTKNTTDWLNSRIVINNHRFFAISAYKSKTYKKKQARGQLVVFVRQKKKQWNRSIKRR